MSPTDPHGSNFAARLYAQLAPFQPLDQLGHLWAFCDGIYAMIQEVESLTTGRDDGLPGWANLVDIDACRDEDLAYLGQFVGVELVPGMTPDQQREYIRALPGFYRCRPATIIAAVKATLTGTKYVDLVERQWNDGSGWQDDAWRYTVITKPSETPNQALTIAAIQSQKPGPDLFYYIGIEAATYAWLGVEYDSYTEMQAAYPTYAALRDAQIT